MPADAPRGDKYERRYWEVIDAAAAEFAEKGYHGASTKAIAERLNIRQGSLYYYFSSKEAALKEVCYRGVEDFVKNLESIAADECSASDKLRRTIFNHLEPVLEHTNYVRVFLNQRHHLPKESRREIGTLSRHYERLIERIIKDGIAAGVFQRDLDARITAFALIGLCNSAVAWLGRRVPLSELHAVADSFANMFLHGVEVQPSTARKKTG